LSQSRCLIYGEAQEHRVTNSGVATSERSFQREKQEEHAANAAMAEGVVL